MTQNAAWNYRRLSQHKSLPNENVVGQEVIDAADTAAREGHIYAGEKYFGKRGKGGAKVRKHTDAVLEQLHHKVMYAPVKLITA